MSQIPLTPFWRYKTLEAMTHEEWESLCDGCGKCCLIRLQDEDTGTMYDSNVVCRLFDRSACTCGDYLNRCRKVPDCVKLTPENIESLDWMPKTCAYRLVAEGCDLPPWHHLITGDRESIHEAGMSVRDRTVCETEINAAEIENYLVNWPGEEEG